MLEAALEGRRQSSKAAPVQAKREPAWQACLGWAGAWDAQHGGQEYGAGSGYAPAHACLDKQRSSAQGHEDSEAQEDDPCGQQGDPSTFSLCRGTTPALHTPRKTGLGCRSACKWRSLLPRAWCMHLALPHAALAQRSMTGRAVSGPICSSESGHAQGLTLKRHIEATLGQGNIREAVRLPPGEDLNEWLAVNTVDFYNAVRDPRLQLRDLRLTQACSRSCAQSPCLLSARPRAQCTCLVGCLVNAAGACPASIARQAGRGWLPGHPRHCRPGLEGSGGPAVRR